MRADQRRDQAGHEQHVDGVEARQRRGVELRAAAHEVTEVGPGDRAGGGDVGGHDRRPVGALVERQQVARQRHHEGEDQQHDADHPVELARVLVGAEEEGPRHVQEDQDHHHRRAPLVHPAHELPEEDVVGDVAGRLVGARRRRVVVHGEEDARHGLGEEREHRRRAQRVEPVRPLRDLAEHQPAHAARQRGALVDPVDGRDPGLLGVVERLGARLAGALGPRVAAVRGAGAWEASSATAWGSRSGAGRGTGRCRRAAGPDRGRSRSA